jgi:hypothetical protein
MGRFGNRAAGHPARAALGTFLPAASRPGLPANLTPSFSGLGTTPVLTGLYQSGPVIGLSKVQLDATLIRRG